MPSIRGANPLDQLSPGVKILILSNVAIFLIQNISPEFFLNYLALRPILVVEKLWVWQIVTYAFLHGNFWHLFFNMFALWMFGPHVERHMGTPSFVRFYAVSVLGAALTQGIIAPTSLVVGASGGIYGILLAFGFLFPDTVIYLFFIFPLRALQAVLFIALLTLVAAIGSGGSKIAHFAHLGGMFAGYLMFKYPIWRDNFQMWRAQRVFRRPRGKRMNPEATSMDAQLQKEVDRILDKISEQGIESLTPEEHETMKTYAKNKG